MNKNQLNEIINIKEYKFYDISEIYQNIEDIKKIKNQKIKQEEKTHILTKLYVLYSKNEKLQKKINLILKENKDFCLDFFNLKKDNIEINKLLYLNDIINDIDYFKTIKKIYGKKEPTISAYYYMEKLFLNIREKVNEKELNEIKFFISEIIEKIDNVYFNSCNYSEQSNIVDLIIDNILEIDKDYPNKHTGLFNVLIEKINKLDCSIKKRIKLKIKEREEKNLTIFDISNLIKQTNKIILSNSYNNLNVSKTKQKEIYDNLDIINELNIIFNNNKNNELYNLKEEDLKEEKINLLIEYQIKNRKINEIEIINGFNELLSLDINRKKKKEIKEKFMKLFFKNKEFDLKIKLLLNFKFYTKEEKKIIIKNLIKETTIEDIIDYKKIYKENINLNIEDIKDILKNVSKIEEFFKLLILDSSINIKSNLNLELINIT